MGEAEASTERAFTPALVDRDGESWRRVRFDLQDPAEAFPPVAPGATIEALFIVFDEGTDTPAGGTIGVPGSVLIDNIDVNGVLIGKPGNAK